MADVNMPKLSDTMEEGTVLGWRKQDGDQVKKGDVIAEIESDKASFEIEAEADGVLDIVVDEGKAVPVGELIAKIGAAGDKKAEQSKQEEPSAEEKPQAEEKPREEPQADEKPAEQRAPAPSAAPKDLPAERGGDGRVKASPIAARLAAEMGVDLGSLKGSGPEGRIVKEDVMTAAEKSKGRAGARQAEARPRPSGPEIEVEEPTRQQATIARRMTQSKQTVPHFYVTVEARVDEAVRLRQQLKETVPGADKVTMTDMLVRACALALRKFPEVNASWNEGRFERKRSINIGLAVPPPPEKGMGLMVPVVHDADRKDLVEISIESRQVIERARSGKPQPGDLEGGTFSISNLGMYGVDEFNAIINPPESGILAVGAIKDAAVVEDGSLAVGKVMRMTLSVDHRVFYGQQAALFMAEVKRLLENPVALVVPPTEG